MPTTVKLKVSRAPKNMYYVLRTVKDSACGAKPKDPAPGVGHACYFTRPPWPPQGTYSRTIAACSRRRSHDLLPDVASPRCCAGGVRGGACSCARPRGDGHACARVRRALARPKRNLVKVAPGHLRKRVKVASQPDRHKMVNVSEGAENIVHTLSLCMVSHDPTTRHERVSVLVMSCT